MGVLRLPRSIIFENLIFVGPLVVAGGGGGGRRSGPTK